MSSRARWHKNAVLTLVERGGSARSFHVESVSAKDIGPIVHDNIARESHLMTDEAKYYTKIGAHFASHHSVDHSRGDMDGLISTDRHRSPQQHRRRIFLNFQAWNDRRLSTLQRKASSPLSCGIRFSLFQPHQARH